MMINDSSFAVFHLSLAFAIVLFSICLSPAFAEPGVLQTMEREFQAIVKSVRPSVVEVIATYRPTTRQYSRRSREMVVDDSTSTRDYQKIGSGIIINSVGHIVTTAAVVDGANQIEAAFVGGQRAPGKVIGVDALTDIAVLSVESDHVPQTQIGDSNQVDTGAWVITVGSSYGHSPTLSFGIVSSLEILSNRPFYNAIKISAPVNPGNSGGAVVNMSGEIVGVIAAVLAEPYFKQMLGLPELLQGQPALLQTPTPQGQIWMREGISFAIPIETVKHITDQLIQYGKVSRGWLGVRLEQENERTTAAGVRVIEVFENNPAQKAGIKRQDVIVEFNGKPVRTYLNLKKLVANTTPETRVMLKIRRDGKLIRREVVLGEME